MSNKTALITQQPSRLFTFGCSFTSYGWPTWANIVAYDLNIPFYNYGKIGAGNEFIFNTLMQADATHRFNKDDLVIVSWTNVCREDRYRNGKWVTPGNIYTQGAYSKDYVKEWACPIRYTLRDFALIKSAWELLDKRQSQFHMLKMMDFDVDNQWEPNKHTNITHLEELYRFYLAAIKPSFYQVLWNNDLDTKIKELDKVYKGKFRDLHPTISEHLEYLEQVFKHSFSERTKQAVNDADAELISIALETVCKGVPDYKVPLDSLFFNRSLPVTHF